VQRSGRDDQAGRGVDTRGSAFNLQVQAAFDSQQYLRMRVGMRTVVTEVATQGADSGCSSL
jgi:hypothetical protein